jgi:hypothetical protein
MKPFKTSILASLVAMGVLAPGLVAVAQPVIANLYPDGLYQFEPSTVISFSATSTVGITNIAVTLTPTTLLGQQGFPRTLSSGNGLTISGSANSENVSAPLASNTLYAANIQVTDANGVSTSSSISFDTISPSYTFEAEDFDYTSNSISGLFVDNPQTNAYTNLIATLNMDYNNGSIGQGNSSYRPQGLETETVGDKARLTHASAQDYDVGYNNGGNWGNYTRHYPAGTYNVYMRGSDGNGQVQDSASLQVVAGTAAIAGTGPFAWSVPNIGGWGGYNWVPLKDSSGALAQITFDGTQSTLRVTTDNGNYNANFYMFVPVVTTPPVIGEGILASNFPDGTYEFQQTNVLTFSVLSTNGINANNVFVQLAGTNLAGVGSAPVLTAGSGLTISGPPTNLTVSALLTTDTVYHVFVEMIDAAGNASTTNITFDTVNPNYYTFEAEDFNWNGGQFFDNPQTNAYYGLPSNQGVDCYLSGSLNANGYGRPNGLNTDSAGDIPRAPYINTFNEELGIPYEDFDVGFTAGGQWGNYTRHYPAGTYNIYIRASDGNSGLTSDSANIALVTSDPTQGSQTTLKLGTFSIAGTGGWSTYGWTPLIDAGGNLARFTADGSAITLRATTDGGNYNVNYYMLVPADTSVHTKPFASGFQPDNSALFQFTNQLSFNVNSAAGIPQANVVVTLNGVNIASSLVFNGSPSMWSVTAPVPTNGFYTAVISVTDSNGTSISTNTFGTFDAADYQLEAEDYDITNGQFFDNQVGAYAGSGGLGNVDVLESDSAAGSRGFNYRANNGYDFPDASAGDLPRSQFTGSGLTDYNIGSFGGGSWANYTRHYPAGTYNVVGRFAEGAGAAYATLSVLTGGYATPAQTTNYLGVFNVASLGWGTWEWSELVDNSGNPVKVTLNGSQTTLQLGGLGNNEVNVNFLMLLPTSPSPLISAALQGGLVNISFFAQSGYNYQVQYTTNLVSGIWVNLGGGLVSGDSATHTVTDSLGGTGRFYRIHP